jgi:hypothetical protein
LANYYIIFYFCHFWGTDAPLKFFMSDIYFSDGRLPDTISDSNHKIDTAAQGAGARDSPEGDFLIRKPG